MFELVGCISSNFILISLSNRSLVGVSLLYNEVLTCKQPKICSAHGEYSNSVNDLSLVFSSVFYNAVLPLCSLEANTVLMFHVQFLAPQEIFFFKLLRHKLSTIVGFDREW